MKISGDEPILLGEGHILLRGSSLRSTEWIYGIAVYTGHDSKVMMNSTRSKAKFSKIELSINKYIVGGICIQTLVCLISAICGSMWLVNQKKEMGDDWREFYIDLAAISGGAVSVEVEEGASVGGGLLAVAR